LISLNDEFHIELLNNKIDIDVPFLQRTFDENREN
jgi:hypothetical protein